MDIEPSQGRLIPVKWHAALSLIQWKIESWSPFFSFSTFCECRKSLLWVARKLIKSECLGKIPENAIATASRFRAQIFANGVVHVNIVSGGFLTEPVAQTNDCDDISVNENHLGSRCYHRSNSITSDTNAIPKFRTVQSHSGAQVLRKCLSARFQPWLWIN